MKWLKDARFEDKVFYTTEKFNGCTYLVEIWIQEFSKMQRFWVAVSSGKKRKMLDVFEAKDIKSSGGLKALFWCRSAIYDFIEFYGPLKPTYVCIAWSDSRRRDIYTKYLKDFKITMIDRKKVLTWKVKK